MEVFSKVRDSLNSQLQASIQAECSRRHSRPVAKPESRFDVAVQKVLLVRAKALQNAVREVNADFHASRLLDVLRILRGDRFCLRLSESARDPRRKLDFYLALTSRGVVVAFDRLVNDDCAVQRFATQTSYSWFLKLRYMKDLVWMAGVSAQGLRENFHRCIRELGQ